MITYKIAEHKIFNVWGSVFLFLVYESAIFKLDPQIKKIIELFNRSKSLNKKEIQKKIKASNIENCKETADTLIRQQIFIPDRVNKTHKQSINKIALKTLVFNITDACNLSCVYCYHNNDTNNKDNTMTTATAKKAIDFLFDNSNANDEAVIVFFGGEPIINFDLITFIVEYAKKKALKIKKKMSFAITTNGTLLTEKVIDFFYENQVGVTISIDGPKDIHDRFRHFSHKGSSYDVMLPKIKSLIDKFQRKRGKPVVARVTVAKDPNHVPKTIDHLLQLGFAEVGFSPVTTDDLSYQLNNKAMNVLLDKFEELSDKFLQAALKDKFFGFTNLIDLLVILHEGEMKNYPCGAGLGLFAVCADENLYLCQRLLRHNSLCMGNLSNGFDISSVKNFRKKAELNGKPECKNCWAKFVCAGGCYHEALVREKKLTKANLHYCAWIKKWIEIGLKIYGKIVLKNSNYLDKLSMLRGHKPLSEQVI